MIISTLDKNLKTSLSPGTRYVWRVASVAADGTKIHSQWQPAFEVPESLDLGGKKILYSNVYTTLADLPDAASYHGMFAHVHAEGAAYYAHAGNWVKLAHDTDVPSSYVSGVNGISGSVTLAAGSNVQIGQLGNQLTISSTQTFTTLNGESGSLSLVGGNGIGVSTVDGIITVSATNHTVVNNIAGNVDIVAGDNINVTTNGTNVVISGQSGGIAWSNPPTLPTDPGDEGDVAYDDSWIYVRTSQGWRRSALGTWNITSSITVQPQDLTIYDGGSGNFTIAATVSDGSTPSYQWQNSDDSGSTWDTITGATGTAYSLSGVSMLDNGTQYRAIVSAVNAPDVTSNVATLTVLETYDLLIESDDRLITEGGDSLDHDGIPPLVLSFTTQPQNTTAVNGDATFTSMAEMSDGSSVTYQWQEGALVSDGATWTQQTLPASEQWSSVTYGNGTFVAVSTYSNAVAAYSNIAATSTDGATWTQRTMPAAAEWTSVTYGNGTFVSVCGGNIAATSTDGVTWTKRTLPASASWVSVTYGDGTFVAVSGSASGSTIAATSTDGISWTQRTLPASALWSSVTYGGGTFVAVADESNIAATSTDGVTWTQRTLPKPSYLSFLNWRSVTHGNNTFVAVATDTFAATSEPILQFAALPGETSQNLSLTGLTTADDGEQYRVIVDGVGVSPVTSNIATLTVT